MWLMIGFKTAKCDMRVLRVPVINKFRNEREEILHSIDTKKKKRQQIKKTCKTNEKNKKIGKLEEENIY